MRKSAMGVRLITAAMLLALATAAASAKPSPGPSPSSVYRLERVVKMAGKAPSWDHLTFDPATGRLYIARRLAGVTVFDTRRHRIVGSIKGAAGANAVVLVPEFDRGYTANGDGVSTVFQISTLKTLAKLKLGESADGAFYDAVHKLIVVTRGDDHKLTFIDAGSGTVTGELVTASKELESVAIDGAGVAYVAERDKVAIAKVDPATRALVQEWPITGGCVLPTGIAIDPVHNRLFVGCKGDKPLMAVIDTANGETVATLPIGRGNDGVAYDAVAKTVITSNGVEGNLVIFDQLDPDHYRLNQAITTQPLARTMAYDPATRAIYTVTAEGLVDPSRPINSRAGAFYPNAYFDDSFKLFVYRPRPYKAPAPADD